MDKCTQSQGTRKAWITLSLLLTCLPCWSSWAADTNVQVIAVELFQLDPILLRPFAEERTCTGVDSTNISAAIASTSSATNTNVVAREAEKSLFKVEFTMEDSDFEMRLFHRLDVQGVFSRPELPTENLLVRAFESAYDPVVIRTRKVEITSPIITAIERKNPLALLNPIFFSLSW